MSIRELIKFQTERSQLIWLEPALKGAQVARYMLVTREILDALNGPFKSANAEKRLGRLRGDLEKFIGGDAISVAYHPYKKEKTAYLARIDPPNERDPVESETWDIRSIDPSPAIRVLGAFAERDLFVALVWEYRENLDGPKGPLWKAFIESAKFEWKRHFLTLTPLKGRMTSDYVSNFFPV